MYIPQFLQSLIQLLFQYKQLTYIFHIHLLLIGLLGSYIIILLFNKRRLQQIQSNHQTQQAKCHSKQNSYYHKVNVRKQTAIKLKQLEQSEQYKKYMAEKGGAGQKNKNNQQKYDDIQNIVLSDDSSLQQNQGDKKNKQSQYNNSRKYKTM